jgi:acetyl esterase/lipase
MHSNDQWYIHPALFLLLCLVYCAPLWGYTEKTPADIEIIRHLTYAGVGPGTLPLDLFRPARARSPLPTVLLIHGGTWMGGTRKEAEPLAQYLAGQGYAAVSIEYRLAPRYVFPTPLQDARAAACWLHDHAGEYKFDLRRYTVIGFSTGGHIAALLGVQPVRGVPSPAGIVTLNSPLDLTAPITDARSQLALRIYLGADRRDRPDLYRQASPITFVSPRTPPFCIVHYAGDTIVPYSQATRMVHALQTARAPVTFIGQPGGEHARIYALTTRERKVLFRIMDFLAGCAPAKEESKVQGPKSKV